MRAFLSSLALATVLTLTGCTEADVSTPIVSASAQESGSTGTKADAQKLQERNYRLITASRQQEDRIRSVTRLVHKMIDDVAAVSGRKGLVRGVKVDQPLYLEADFPQTERSIRAAERVCIAHLSVIESHLQESEQTLLRVGEAEVAPDASAELRDRIAALTETVADVRKEVEQLSALRDSLAGVAGALEADAATLKAENDRMAEETESLRRAYYVAGTPGELSERSIIDKRFLRAPVVNAIRPTDFTPTSVDTRIIPLDRPVDDILSTHRHAPDLYTVEAERIVIHDPAAFWALSRYLIVVVDE